MINVVKISLYLIYLVLHIFFSVLTMQNPLKHVDIYSLATTSVTPLRVGPFFVCRFVDCCCRSHFPQQPKDLVAVEAI